MKVNRAPVGSSSPRKALVPAAAGLCGTDANHAWLANVRLVSKSASPPAAAVATARSARRSSIAWLARSAAPRWRCLADWKKRRGDGRRRCLIRARRARQRRSKKRLLRYSAARAVKSASAELALRAGTFGESSKFFTPKLVNSTPRTLGLLRYSSSSEECLPSPRRLAITASCCASSAECVLHAREGCKRLRATAYACTPVR